MVKLLSQTTGGVLGRNGRTAISGSTIPIPSARKMRAGSGKGSSAVAILQFQGQLTHGSHYLYMEEEERHVPNINN